mgnify:CR=1 FL=1
MGRLRVILASSSKRRLELLESIGLKPIVIPPKYKEVRSGTPWELCMLNAFGKAMEVADMAPYDALVIGADTLLYHRERVIGKPRDMREAEHILSMLSGNEHYVYTGLCVVRTDTWEIAQGYEVTKVFFKELSPMEVKKYLAIEDPLDKAGGYAVQGLASLLITRIEGDFFNVVGLPLHLLYLLLKVIGIDVFDMIKSKNRQSLDGSQDI